MEAASSTRPLPHFDYMPTTGCEPSHRYAPVASHGHRPQRRTQHTPDEPLGSRRRSKPRDLEGRLQDGNEPLSIAPITLHELADKGQIDRFLKRGSWFLQKEREPVRPEPRDEECSTKIVDTIASGYAEGIAQFAWKAQLSMAQQVLMAKQESRVTKLKYPGREIVPLVHPILGFGGQEVNPIRMIRLPLRFGNKTKVKNLEVDFLVVDVPTSYNVILGDPFCTR
ncbi:hypothetical protein Cgig2_015566 [Carnegiea gigantea]|uniref:Uncharacterized protein n=1 Tax=Carnegiea gigantea TaxID=171969 RepID=A0A9Q1QB79_9CARY|nr:hypothetical protein Cgig2_015566 [Carnegiea gigantea]